MIDTKDIKAGDEIALVHTGGSWLAQVVVRAPDSIHKTLWVGPQHLFFPFGIMLDSLPLGWSLTVHKPKVVLPTVPGVYSVVRALRDGGYDTDGRELHLLNRFGNWCDLGWGNGPTASDAASLLVPAAPDRDQIIRDVIGKAFRLGMITVGDADRLHDAFGVAS